MYFFSNLKHASQYILEQAARAQSRSSVEDLSKRQWRFDKRNRGELAELYYYAAQARPLTEKNLLRSDEGVLQYVGQEGCLKGVEKDAKRDFD